MTPVRAVVFDYGHTFLDFAPAEDELLRAYREIRRMLQEQAYRELPAAADLVRDVSRHVDRLAQESFIRGDLEELDIVDMFEEALQGQGLQLPRELVERIVVMEHEALASRLEVPDENLDVLRQLRAQGLQLGLVSNAHFLPRMMQADIERLGIAQHVDSTVFSSEVGVRKPHPAIFLKVLDELHVPPAQAVFVGDRLREDVGGAKALGMRAVLTRQYRHEEPHGQEVVPDYVVDYLPDLVPYVARLLSSGSRA